MAEKSIIEADLVADTRDSEARLGFRNVASAERRLLFRTDDAYVELRIPPTGADGEANGWLYGQFIRPDDGETQFQPPYYAVLQGGAGVTGAVRATDMGDFAVPFRGSGDFVLDVEPSVGPVVRARFRQ